jgi:hypothetical protein
MRLLARRKLLFLGVAVVAACSTGSGRTPRPGATSTLITRDELSRVPAMNALEAIRSLRPDMLRNRGQTSFLTNTGGEPVVYLDERRMGSLSALQNISVQNVMEIRYYSGTEAHQKWGSGHSSGAIQVVMARAPGVGRAEWE